MPEVAAGSSTDRQTATSLQSQPQNAPARQPCSPENTHLFAVHITRCKAVTPHKTTKIKEEIKYAGVSAVPPGCAIRKRAFRATMESLGSSALHRELQTKLPPLQFPGQMELRQDVIHQAPTTRFFLARLGRDYMVVAAGGEPTETCGQTIWGSRLWCPCSVQTELPTAPCEGGLC